MGQTLTHSISRVKAGRFFFGIIAAFVLLPILAQAQPVTATITSTNVSCFGLCDGSATVTAAGGWAPYTYAWSTGATTATITGLCAGTYSVTVTDIDLGFAIVSVTITQPSQLGVTVNAQQQQLCGVAPDGQASVTPYGGTPPYTYLWSYNNLTTPQITGLPAGTYTVTVTDAHGCTAAGSALITFSPEGIWVIDSTVNVSCFGYNNGFIHVGAMTGTPPYTFTWSNGQSGPNLSNLGPGVYSVTTTDANGCTNLHTVTITQPPQLVLNMSMTDALCGLPGSATISPSGGTPPYSITWSFNNSHNFTITAPAGSYSVTVTDANGCSAVKNLTIGGSNTGLTVNVTLVSNAGCAPTGSATATASGGGGNYTYFWDSGATTATATNLAAGPHRVTVTDVVTGCTGVGMTNIPSASSLVVSVVLGSNATCATGGSATVSATGGTPPYTYHWDNGQITPTATNLMAGVHTVTVTDASNCVATGSVTIGQSQGPTVTIQVTSNATCTAGGTATATATGGSGTYSYLWSNGQVTATATGLTAGTYKVTVSDAAGCSAMASVTITQNGAPTVIISASTSAGCNASGSATAAASGGTGPYTFKWSNGNMTPVVSGLAAGSYTVTVTDAAGCTATAVVSVAAGIPPGVVIVASSNAKCDQPGSATASANGGAGNYAYRWDNGELTATAVNLVAGVHTVTVTDGVGCTATASVTIGFAANGIKLGDFVFYDNDQNGVQALGEPGVPNFTVMLIKAGPDNVFGTADDVIVQSTTTNSNGKYEFACVTPGTYVVMFSGLPPGYQFTIANYPANNCLDSDALPNGKTNVFTVLPGQGDDLCIDAGIHTICVPILNPGLICCDQTICEGQAPATITSAQDPSGGTGALQYMWIQYIALGPAGPQWVGIPGAMGPTFSPGPLFQTSYYRRCVRRAGCEDFLETNVVTITVRPAGSPGCPTFISSINALRQGPNSVVVNWETLPEGDDYMYTVERSPDQSTWVNVGLPVPGKHDIGHNNNYAVVDQGPDNGANYYRVKRVNSIGTETFSRTVSVEMNMELSITPNPVNDKLHIKNLTLINSDVTVRLVSLQGKLLRSIVVKAGTLQQVDVDMADLPEGLYIVRLDFGNGRTQALKITKF